MLKLARRLCQSPEHWSVLVLLQVYFPDPALLLLLIFETPTRHLEGFFFRWHFHLRLRIKLFFQCFLRSSKVSSLCFYNAGLSFRRTPVKNRSRREIPTPGYASSTSSRVAMAFGFGWPAGSLNSLFGGTFRPNSPLLG